MMWASRSFSVPLFPCQLLLKYFEIAVRFRWRGNFCFASCHCERRNWEMRMGPPWFHPSEVPIDWAVRILGSAWISRRDNLGKWNSLGKWPEAHLDSSIIIVLFIFLNRKRNEFLDSSNFWNRPIYL